eukprot:m.36443 g.36443  ORF g.36443 m.36443 type:complete len:208 (+) comp9113_c0_seq1:112-735(+)
MSVLCKRAFDQLGDSSPDKWEAMSATFKRCRLMKPSNTSPNATLSHKSRPHISPSSHFQPPKSCAVDIDYHIGESIKKRRRAMRVERKEASFAIPSYDDDGKYEPMEPPRSKRRAEGGPGYEPHHQKVFRSNDAENTRPELLFTVDQVRSIVEKAVKDNEVQLSQVYDKILESKMQGKQIGYNVCHVESSDAFPSHYRTAIAILKIQ